VQTTLLQLLDTFAYIDALVCRVVTTHVGYCIYVGAGQRRTSYRFSVYPPPLQVYQKRINVMYDTVMERKNCYSRGTVEAVKFQDDNLKPVAENEGFDT
jgi:hypothetical protein